MALDSLMDEAEKIKGILEGKLKYRLRCITGFSYFFVKPAEYTPEGVLKHGHYFGIDCSLEDVEQLESELKTGIKIKHLYIRVLRDYQNAPKVIELSDGEKTCIIERAPRGYAMLEREGGFVIP